jgi:hypothetical protein
LRFSPFILRFCCPFFLALASVTASGQSSDPILRSSVKSVRSVTQRKNTSATLSLRVQWQVVRSLSRSGGMATAAESFQTKATIRLASPGRLELQLNDHLIPVSGDIGRVGVDGFLFVDRFELLRALRALPPEMYLASGEDESIPAMGGLPLFRLPARHMETIFRSPDEDLYLVRIMLAVDGGKEL